MSINWITVFFQLIYFLIIVWILKKYLFKPVLAAMDNREKTIQARLMKAAEAVKEAEKEKTSMEKKVTDLEKAKDKVLADAEDKAIDKYNKMLATFNDEVQANRKTFEEQMILERELLRNSIRELANSVIINTISDALEDLAGATVKEALITTFIKKLSNNSFKDLKDLKKYYQKHGSIKVNSSFEITSLQQKEISNLILGLIGEKSIDIEFIVEEKILCGIEVLCLPLMITYGLNTYMEELKSNLDDGIAKLTDTKITAN